MLQRGAGSGKRPFFQWLEDKIMHGLLRPVLSTTGIPNAFLPSRSRFRTSTNRTSLGASNPSINHHALKPTQTRLHFPVPSLRLRSSNSHQSYTRPIPSLPILSLYQYSMHTHTNPKHTPMIHSLFFFFSFLCIPSSTTRWADKRSGRLSEINTSTRRSGSAYRLIFLAFVCLFDLLLEFTLREWRSRYCDITFEGFCCLMR